jgi:hypothetical protein
MRKTKRRKTNRMRPSRELLTVAATIAHAPSSATDERAACGATHGMAAHTTHGDSAVTTDTTSTANTTKDATTSAANGMMTETATSATIETLTTARCEASGPPANSNECRTMKLEDSQERGSAANSVSPLIKKRQSSTPSLPARQGRVGRGSDGSIRGQRSSGYPDQSSIYAEDDGEIAMAGMASRWRCSRLGEENQDKEETTSNPRAGLAWTSSNDYGRTAESDNN